GACAPHGAGRLRRTRSTRQGGPRAAEVARPLSRAGRIPRMERSMITKLSMGLACAAVAIGASRAGADVVRLAVRSQPPHDARLGITYGFSHSTDGGIDMSAEAADLQVRKTS